MNSLSWLIYLTHLISSLNNVGVGLTIIAILSGIILLVITLIIAIGTDSFEHLPKIKSYVKYPVFILIIGILLETFVPNQRTMLLIASSEIGQRVASDPKVQGVIDPSLDLLKNWIALETKKVKKELEDKK